MTGFFILFYPFFFTGQTAEGGVDPLRRIFAGDLLWNLPFGNEKVVKDLDKNPENTFSGVPEIEGETWNENLYRKAQLLSLHGQNKDALAKTKLGAWE